MVPTVNRKFSQKLNWALVFISWISLAHADVWRFAVIGDTPYSDYERAELPEILAAVADSRVEFVAHIGDIKSGRERCDDRLFEDRHGVFNASRALRFCARALLIEFGAPWCGHCQTAQPLIEVAMNEHTGLAHLKIEDGPGRPLGRAFRIKLWPTLVFMKGGEEIARLVEAMGAIDPV